MSRGPGLKQVWDQVVVKEACSLLTLPLFSSFNFFVAFLVCLFMLITVKKIETKPSRLVSFPHPSTLFRMVIRSHNRQRQKRVGMKTPKATRMGNMRLLLSEA